MWLRIAFIQCIKTFFAWYVIYAVCFTSFYMLYPQNYLGYFDRGTVYLLTIQRYLWRQGIKLEVLLGF